MKEKRLNSWEEFESEVSQVFKDLENKRRATGLYVSPLLFRGHAKESWKLETTLERYSIKQYLFQDYFDLLRAIKPAVSSFTSKSWELSSD